ncbi:MAG TPA: M13 family metallopeptidase, partial [Anaeromyxobacteraceae bacterium]|nr:M13 family metallopeptidase [Anaeromyxobacteraceae bacterium]
RVAPGNEFYDHANGAWMAAAVIPPDRAYSGPILAVQEVVVARTRAIDEEAARAGAPKGSELQQIGDTWASFMDEATIEARGAEPLRPALARIAAIGDRRQLAVFLGGTVRADVDLLNSTDLHTPNVLGLWVEQDLDDPSRNAAYLVQGGLGLPDRSYYLDEGSDFSSLRVKYRVHLAAMFRLAGTPAAEADARAERVLAHETKLARTHASRTDTYDVQKGNNPWTRAELVARAPGLDWGAFLEAAGLARQPGFIVWQPGAVKGLAALVASEPVAIWKEYLEARALEQAAPYLSRAFVEESFRFHGAELQGTARMLPRWMRAVAVTDAALGEAVGKLYVARHFPEEARRELQGMVDRIVAAFDRRLDALDWMSPATREMARKKLAAMKVGIARPDAWKSYAGLKVVRGDAFGNQERASHHAYEQALARLGRAPDRGAWAMLPQTVNAVNLPVRNALNFPAGYLEPPFYDRDASLAVKYATIGATIGHEVTHGFDDQGALFDAEGRLRSWWTPEDMRHFEAAGQRLVAQYDAYRPFPDLAVNGKLTLSENIADLAGLAAAHDAWRDALGGAPAPVLDGLTGEQQFFLAYAQSHRVKERDPALREAVLTDGHSPGRYRALTVRNLDAWYPAFGVSPGQGLYLAPADRVRVW